MVNVARLVLVLAALAGPAAYAQQPLLDTTLTIGKKPDPIEKTLTVAVDGNLRLTITDFGTTAGPQRLGRLDVAVARGSAIVTSASLTSSVATGVATKNFDATAGSYRVIIIGQPASPARVGAAGVRIETQTGTVLLDAPLTFEVPGPSPPAFPVDISVSPGSYTLEITDFALPQTANVVTTVIPQSTGVALPNINGSGQIQITAGGADVLQVFVSTLLPQGATRGLVGVNLRDTATGAKKFAEVHELGEWQYRFPFDVASATTLTATLTDLGFPFPLLSSGAVLVHDARRVGQTIAGAGSTNGAAEAGAYTAYLQATPSASGPGSAGLVVSDGAGTKLVQAVQPTVASTTTDVGTFDLGFDIQSAGHYTATLTDFGLTGFFDAFATLSLALTQDSQVVGSPLTAAGNLEFDASPGHYSLAIIADPSGTAGQSLLDVRVHGGTGDATVLDETRAVGAGFISATVTVAAAQKLDVVLSDLAFPDLFDAVKVIVTRGEAHPAELMGSGTFSFDATPGKYLVNLVATPKPTPGAGYGTFGLKVTQTVPVPTVTFASSASTVDAGSSVTLTWSATDATNCTASGSWTGSRGTSGSVSAGPLTADSTFTLTCTGGGGRKDASVSVTVRQAQRSGGGGGGGMDWLLLAWLGGAAVARCTLRRRELR